MKRLFYATNDLDDAESISDEVHALGIDDHHFFVLSRDEKGIKTHHLHGARSIENTHILAAERRANWFALLALVLVGGGIALSVDLIGENTFLMVLIGCAVFGVAKFLASVAGSSFNEYIKGVFNTHLNKGEVIVIIDVDSHQADKVEKQMRQHPAASFLADSSNIASPIPN